MMLNSDVIARLPFLSDVESEVLQVIEQKSIYISKWPKDRIIYSPIDPSGRVIGLISGTVELVSTNRGAIWHYGAGSLLGIEALSASAYQYTAIPRTECRLLVLDPWFKALTHKVPSMQRAINSYSRLHQHEWEDYQSKMLSVNKPGRVALGLLNVARAVERPKIIENDGIDFPYTVSWWSSKRVISELLLSVCAPKVREALTILAKEEILYSEEEANDRILPPILKANCVPKLERLIEMTF